MSDAAEVDGGGGEVGGGRSSRSGLSGAPGLSVGVVDEFALGLGVSLAVRSEAPGERSLQGDVIGSELPISSETVPKSQAPVDVLALVH